MGAEHALDDTARASVEMVAQNGGMEEMSPLDSWIVDFFDFFLSYVPVHDNPLIRDGRFWPGPLGKFLYKMRPK